MRKMLLIILGLTFVSSLLSSCGIAAKIDSRNDMMQSKNNYKNCLAQHPQNPNACESARLAYDADMKAYRATSAGLMSGNNDSININTSNE